MQDSSVPFPPRRILVVSGCTRDSGEAVRQAAIMTRVSGAELTVCRVIPGSPQDGDPRKHPVASGTDDLPPRLAQATRELADYLFAVLGKDADGFHLRVGIGDAKATIVGFAKELGSDLIVVSSQDAGSPSPSALGTLADSLIRHAECSVLVARPIQCNGLVLVTTDFSDRSIPAIVAADAIARRSRARLVVVHSIDLGASSDPRDVPRLDEGISSAWKTARVKARSIAESRLAALIHSLKVNGEGRALEGPASEAVLNAVKAMQPALLVMDTHGRTGLARVPFGSVTEEVVYRAVCPVLIVRGV